MSLIAEVLRPIYAGLDDDVVLATLQNVYTVETNLIPATTVNQLFAQLDLTGIIQDIAADHQHPFRHKMASVLLSIGGDHPFNFIQGTVAGDGNIAMLNQMITGMPDIADKLTGFRNTMVALANKKKYPFAGVTLSQVSAARAVQVDGQWHEIPETQSARVNVKMLARVPEPVSIVVQWQDAVGDWYHATAIHGIEAARDYQASVPFYGTPRKLRWKCEYLLNVEVTAV